MVRASRPKAAKANLFIVGAPKCGTSAWRTYLRSHPQIFFSEVKEPNYFASDLPGIRWTSDIAQYDGLFAGADEPVRGESSSLHLFSDAAAKNIRRYNPSAKILIFLRHQEQFLPSWHHQLLYNFTESLKDFDTAWDLSGHRPADTIPSTCKEPGLLDYARMGHFKEQVDRYLAAFPAEQVRVIRYRQWTADPRQTYLEILDFLGLEDDGRTEFPKVNYAKTHRSAFLGRLISHPPRFVRAMVEAIKKATGKSTLDLARWAARQIEKPGYTTQVSDRVREEIRARYAEENRLLGLGAAAK